MTHLMRINILGTDYNVILKNKDEDAKLDSCDGYVDTSIKHIVVDDMKTCNEDPAAKADLEYYQRQVLQHEIIHAFLFESGLDVNCDWACCEETVDWIAIQLPKLAALMEKGGLL